MIKVLPNNSSVNTRRRVAKKSKASALGTLAERVRSLRKLRGLTQDELKELSGVAQPTISAIEKGESLWVRGPTLIKLAEALLVAPKWLGQGNDSGDRDEDSTKDEERELVSMYRAMSTHLRAAWVAAGTALLRAKTGKNGHGKPPKKHEGPD